MSNTEPTQADIEDWLIAFRARAAALLATARKRPQGVRHWKEGVDLHSFNRATEAMSDADAIVLMEAQALLAIERHRTGNLT